jgi:hypothetical protein
VIVVSLLTYELGKSLGIDGAAREVSSQLAGECLDGDELPAVRTIQRLRGLDELMLYHGASTTLPKARSRAAHAALAAAGADLWLMIDDDVETDLDTLSRLIAIARAGKVAVLPCAVRSTALDHRINVLWHGTLVGVANGVSSREVSRGGCGLMIVPRSALERVIDQYRDELAYQDDDGAERVAIFSQLFVRVLRGNSPPGDVRLWLGEDFSFCERLRASGVEIAAPIEGQSIHDGVMLDLADAAALPY